MYKMKDKTSVETLKKIMNKHLLPNGRASWKTATPELNSVFGEQCSPNGWQKRAERLSLTFEQNKKIKMEEPIIDMEGKRLLLIDLLRNRATIPVLMTKLALSRYEILGLIKEIEDEGIFAVKKTEDDENPFYTLERNLIPERNKYNHAIGETSTFTFMVISDSHLGSKNEQLTFLNFLYDEAERRGITNVYHCGDISEGFKKSRDDHMYSLHSIGFDDQADYIIRNYPERESVTTYFITGNHDHFHIQNGGANIGKRIAASREDMVYLGINTAVINLTDNCKMELFHPQDGSAYALSYAGQKYLDSLSGGDKPNILFVGHHHKYISMWYRNVWYFEVPSTHLQSDWEKGKRIRNDSGALIVTVTVDEEGTLVDCNHSMIPHIKHIKDDWKSYAILK